MTTHSLDFELPTGINLERELFGTGAFGRVFVVLDGRFDSEAPARRVMRVLPEAHDDWMTSLRERLTALLDTNLPYVAVPRDAGFLADGRLFTISDYLDQPLSAKIQPTKGINADEASAFIEQCFQGLAALHRLGIAHGDLRAKNIFLTTTGRSIDGMTIWIGDPVIGGLEYWSNGALFDNESRNYCPPEWQGRSQKPSPSADVYALGMVACELLAGYDANPARRSASNLDWRPLRIKLNEAGASPAMVHLVGECLAPSDGRPGDAVEALKRLRRAQHKQRSRPWLYSSLGLLALLVLTVFLLGTAWRGSKAAADAALATTRLAQEDLKSANAQLAKKDELVKQKDKQIDALEAHNASLAGQLRLRESKIGDLDGMTGVPLSEAVRALVAEVKGPDSPPDTLSEAKRWWTKHVAERFDERDAFSQAWPGRYPLETIPDKQRSLVGRWLRSLEGLRLRAKPWAERGKSAEDSGVKGKYLVAAKKPWKDDEGDALKDASVFLTMLENARREWDSWARDEERQFADLETLIKACPQEEQAILNRWRGEMLSRKKWTLRLLAGKAQANDTAKRLVTIYSPGKSNGVAHDWKSATKHSYSTDETDVREIQFDWRPGDPIEVVMEGDWNWYSFGVRWNLIEQQVNGPLAAYYLHYLGQLGNKERSLRVEVVDCPGPPRVNAIAETPARAGAASKTSGGTKRVVPSKPPTTPKKTKAGTASKSTSPATPTGAK